MSFFIIIHCIVIVLCNSAVITYDTWDSINAKKISSTLSFGEFSGITYNPDDSLYYCISDSIVQNKGFYGFNINGNSVNYVNGIQMSNAGDIEVSRMDSECIAYYYDIKMNESLYFISTEGYDIYNQTNGIYLYKSSGEYVREVDIDGLFSDDNVVNNRGIESMDIDPVYKDILVYGNEKPLKSDNCDNCVRIVVNRINEYNISVEYMVRYDVEGKQFSLVDIVLFYEKDNPNYLRALTLERFTDGVFYNNKIYVIDLNLTLNGVSDVSDCIDLNDCNNIESVPKELVFWYSQSISQLSQLSTKLLNFEGLSMIYNDDGSYYDNNGKIKLVSINDNGDDFDMDNYFVFLTYDPNGEMSSGIGSGRKKGMFHQNIKL